MLTEVLAPQVSMFGELMTVQRTPIIELNSIYGPSALRDVQTTANGGSVALASGEIRLRTGSTANGSAKLESAERGRYIPGYSGEVGVGIRIPTAPTGNQVATWGLLSPDGEEGIYFGQDATGVYAARKTGGVETIYRQSAWNVDKADGSGRSLFNLDMASGNIFQVRFSWYGYGQVQWGIAGNAGRQQTFIVCHEETYDGFSIQTPNLPVSANVTNGGDAASLDAYIGGRQYSIIGTYEPRVRYTGQERMGVSTSTTSVPIVTFRSKTGFTNRSIKVSGYANKPVSEDVIIELRLNGTLTGASYVTPTNHMASETALETDISATAITGGQVIWTEYVQAGTVGQGSLSGRGRLDLDIPEDQPVTLCARTLSGTGTISSHFRLAEEW